MREGSSYGTEESASGLPPQELRAARPDLELEWPLCYFPFHALPRHVVTGPLPDGVAKRPLAPRHLAQVDLAVPPEVDLLALGFPHEPPGLPAGGEPVDGAAGHRGQLGAGVHGNRRRPARDEGPA